MSYKVKIFLGAQDKVEADMNKWLGENNVEPIQVISAISLAAVPVQVTPVTPLVRGQGMGTQVQVQSTYAFSVTIIYKENSPNA